MSNCIDLRKMFGREFRIDRDPAYFAEYGNNARTRDLWYWRILCQHGHIYQHGRNQLGASTDRHGSIATRLAKITGVKVVQDGSDGINAAFDLEQFEEVAKIMKPRRRRQLSAAHRATLVASGAKALARYRNCGAEIPPFACSA